VEYFPVWECRHKPDAQAREACGRRHARNAYGGQSRPRRSDVADSPHCAGKCISFNPPPQPPERIVERGSAGPIQLDQVEEKVYNLTDAEPENYAVGSWDVVVHNTNDMPRCRYHTDSTGLAGIKSDMAIKPGRAQCPGGSGVNVEVEPFGPTTPGLNSPARQVGAANRAGTAYVEFDLPASAVPDPMSVGPRNTASIPTKTPLRIGDLNPIFVEVRQWWNLWYFWRWGD
jgi:hypothetical protein